MTVTRAPLAVAEPGCATPEPKPRREGMMRRLVGWCIAHRRRVVVAWVAVAVLTTLLATAVGRHYSTDFTLRGTESQQARDLLARQFPSQSGDIDTIVYRVATGSVDDSRVRAAITRLLSEVKADAHVSGIVSPYSPRGAAQISRDRRTAFAVVDYDQPGQPAAHRRREAGARAGRAGSRSRADRRRGRTGDGERRRLPHRAGDRDRGDRRVGHPAADVRLAARGRAAAADGRSGPADCGRSRSASPRASPAWPTWRLSWR